MEHRLWSQKTVFFLAVTSGRLVDLSESQCSHWQNGASLSTNRSMVSPLGEVYEWWGELQFLKCVPCCGFHRITSLSTAKPCDGDTGNCSLESLATQCVEKSGFKLRSIDPQTFASITQLHIHRLMYGEGLWKLWRARYVIIIGFACCLIWIYARLLNSFFAYWYLEEKSLGKLSLPSRAPGREMQWSLQRLHLPACLVALPIFHFWGERSSWSGFSRDPTGRDREPSPPLSLFPGVRVSSGRTSSFLSKSLHLFSRI